MLSKDEILRASDSKTRTVAVPEWGGDVCVRVLTGAERDRFEAAIQPDKNGKRTIQNFRAHFAALVLCDDAGKRLFNDGDVVKLAEKSAAALDRVIAAGFKLNGLSQAEVDDLAGESGADQNSGSGSGSPATSASR